MVEVEPGFRVVHVDAGPRAPVPKHDAARARRAVRRTRDRRACSTRAAGRGPARELLAVGRGRAPAEARARSAAGRDVPHARAGARPTPASTTIPTTARASSTRSIACADLMLASTDAERDQLATALRRRRRAHRDRPARRRPLGVLARVIARSAPDADSGSTAGRVLLFVGPHPAAEGRRPRGALPRRARRPRRDADGRRRSERSRRRRRAARACTALAARARRCRRTCGSCRPSPTTASPTSTAPPTCASCLARRVVRPRCARGRGVRHAGGRRRRWADCVRSSTTARRASSSTAATPRSTPRRSRRCSTIPRSRPRSARPRRRARGATRGASTAARLRRLYGDLVARGLVRCD